MGERKIIWIPAVPSSGSSAAAAVLQVLGVSMGKLNRTAWMDVRGYDMWEDPDFFMFGAEYGYSGLKTEAVARRHFRLRDYINYRFIQEPEGRVGFKGLPAWFADDRQPTSLPVDILDIHRPLEDSILADQKRNHERPNRHGPRANIMAPTAEAERLRAGSLSTCWLAKRQLFLAHKPVYQVAFYELLKNPQEHVEGIVDAFHLTPTHDQIEAAVAVINPRMRTV
jgi:hypothetical protein